MHESTWGRNNYIRIKQKSLKLILHVVTTSDKNESQIRKFSNISEICSSLQSNFSGWRQDHGPCTNCLRMFLKLLHYWNNKSSGFSRTCSCHSDYVETLENRWNNLSLNRRGQIITLELDPFQHLLWQVVMAESSAYFTSLALLCLLHLMRVVTFRLCLVLLELCEEISIVGFHSYDLSIKLKYF